MFYGHKVEEMSFETDPTNWDDMAQFQLDVADEVKRARDKFPEFHSYHEGYAVMLEELDEIWDEVKAKSHNEGSRKRIYKECVQLAAMTFCMATEPQH